MQQSDLDPNTPRADPATAGSGSTFARVGLLMYAFLIVYASWYPLSNWRGLGLPFWAFLFAPLPYYWTGFDVVTNIIGYMPFGLLVVFALYPYVRGVSDAIIDTCAGGALSFTMEAVQTYLPSRVASNLDFLTNELGALLGAIAGVMLTRAFLEQSRLLQLRKRWFVPEAGRGLIVAGLWPLAQIYPQGSLFGLGQVLPIFSEWLTQWLERPVDLGVLLRHGLELSAQEYWLAETIITACGLTGALLSVSCMLRKQSPRAALLIGLLLIALGVKSLTSALYFAPDNAFVWLTPGAKGGLLIGGMMLSGLAFAPQVAQRRLAVASLLLCFATVNFVPANPYFISTMQAWSQGKFLNFNGAAQFLSQAWPLFALRFLLHPMHRLNRK